MTVRHFDTPEQVAKHEGVYQEFTLRGVEFKARPFMDHKDFGALTAVGALTSEGDLAAIVSDAIRNTLLPEYHAAWDELLSTYHDVPITYQTLNDIAGFLMEGATGRPTVQPSSSGTTAERTSTPSTGGFVSLVAPGSTPSQ